MCGFVEMIVWTLQCGQFLWQQKEMLKKELPETWKLAISKKIEKKLFSKVPLATHPKFELNHSI
jgi:hypothetical protein